MHSRLIRNLNAPVACDRRDVLVAPARQADDHALVAAHLGCELPGLRHRVRTLDRADNTFRPREIFESLHRLVVRDRHILRAADIMQPGVLRADPGIVEAR